MTDQRILLWLVKTEQETFVVGQMSEQDRNLMLATYNSIDWSGHEE